LQADGWRGGACARSTGLECGGTTAFGDNGGGESEDECCLGDGLALVAWVLGWR
jgi:hypothetical protein